MERRNGDTSRAREERHYGALCCIGMDFGGGDEGTGGDGWDGWAAKQ